MKRFFSILVSFILISGTIAQNNKDSYQKIIYNEKDVEILEQIFSIFSNEKETPISVLIIKVGTFFKSTPYVAHTLEIEPENERLVINLREMDCTTFAENCLAISRTIKSSNPSFENFANQLQKIRYRDGKINGYPSRLHYFSDWIFDIDKKNIAKSVSEEMGKTPFIKQINFMSTHPESYVQLKDNKELIQTIENQENEISSRKMYFIPEEKIKLNEDKFRDGDIVGITTSINGLDILHVGILVRKGERIHLLHASSEQEQVIVSENSLEEYLLNSKLATGIMVARPL